MYFELHEVSNGIYKDIEDWNKGKIHDYIEYKNRKYNELKKQKNV